MFTDSLFERAGGFTYITQPTWTFNHVDSMGGGARNNVNYLKPFSCMWVAEIFTHTLSLLLHCVPLHL
jgi:hypothetical protein